MSRRPALRETPACSVAPAAGRAPEGEGAGTVHVCPLCGFRYTTGIPACAACPLHAGCNGVRCPHCGYQIPGESRLVRWVTRLFGGRYGENG